LDGVETVDVYGLRFLLGVYMTWQIERRRGDNAESVASWYFRLNGFLSIPGFVVHPDVVRPHPVTEADLIAVRFPFSGEFIADRPMIDDQILTRLAHHQTLFLLVEVKTDLCKINGPWSDPGTGSMQRVIRRLGFADSARVEEIAQSMYSHLRWEDSLTVLQYVVVGKRKNDTRQRQYPKLVQITWDIIADFLFSRFTHFPEKLPGNGRAVHAQWPDFGRFYGRKHRALSSSKESRRAVWEYIDHGIK